MAVRHHVFVAIPAGRALPTTNLPPELDRYRDGRLTLLIPATSAIDPTRPRVYPLVSP